MLTGQNENGSQHSPLVSQIIYAYCGRYMEHNQNMIDAINNRRAIRSNFMSIIDYFWLLLRGYFGCLAVGDALQ